MPYRRRTARRPSAVGPVERDYLMVGLPFNGEHPFGYVRDNPDALDLAPAERGWAQLRDELLAECEPGRRPSAWWDFEAPGDRLTLGRVEIRAGDPGAGPGGHDFEVREDECAALVRLGCATPEDVAELRRRVADEERRMGEIYRRSELWWHRSARINHEHNRAVLAEYDRRMSATARTRDRRTGG